MSDKQTTIGGASHIEKLDEINRLRGVNAADLVAALEAVKDQAVATQHSPGARLVTVFDIATKAIRKDEIANCEYCREIAAKGGFGPSHFASPNCQSGRRNHCSCDTCF